MHQIHLNLKGGVMKRWLPNSRWIGTSYDPNQENMTGGPSRSGLTILDSLESGPGGPKKGLLVCLSR